MKMAEFLGKPASYLLDAEPFKRWLFERCVDDDADPPEVRYAFKRSGLELNCDRESEIVQCVFLKAQEHDGTVLSEVPFNLSREQVMARFGSPSRSGDRVSDPLLGDSGPWDRFQGPEYTVHIQYGLDAEHITMVTLMRNDVVP